MSSRDDARPTVPDFLTGGGVMGALMRAHGWVATPLGSPESWPQALRSALSTCLNSAAVSAIYWGPEFRLFYNDGYRPFLEDRHPQALGRPMSEVWPAMWGALRVQAQSVMNTGKGLVAENQQLMLERAEGLVESYWYYSFAPIRGETGLVEGVLVTALDTTARTLAERTQAFRLGLEHRLREIANPAGVIAVACEALGRHLGVPQVAYAEVEAGDETVVIDNDWNEGKTADNRRRHRLDDYGPELIAGLRQGATTAISDVRLDACTSSPEALVAFATASIRALLNVPVVKAGRLTAILGVHSDVPRAWSPEGVALAQEIAERTWAAAGRARAETARDESEEFSRRVLASSADCIKVLCRDGRLERMSEGGQRALGITDVAAHLGSVWAEGFEPEWRAIAYAAVEQAARGRTSRFEGSLTHDRRPAALVRFGPDADLGRKRSVRARARDLARHHRSAHRS